MKKISILGLLLTGLVMAASVAKAETDAAKPRMSNGQYFDNPSFIGMESGIIKYTIAATVIDSNDQGLLYGICRQSEVAGDYALAFDYYTSLSNLPAHLGRNLAGDAYIISPYVYSQGANQDYKPEAQWGCWTPKWPVRYEAGLVGIQSSDDGFSLYFYRTDDGNNPK